MSSLVETSPRNDLSAVRPLIVRPTVARKMLGGIGPARLWEMLKVGDLQSYLVGRSRFILVASIEDYISRHLAEARDQSGRVRLYGQAPAKGKGGRPRKKKD